MTDIRKLKPSQKAAVLQEARKDGVLPRQATITVSSGPRRRKPMTTADREAKIIAALADLTRAEKLDILRRVIADVQAD